MTLDQYMLEWSTDAPLPLPVESLDDAGRAVPILHAKYWRFYSAERLAFKHLELEYKVLHRQKFEWYNGKMLDEDRKALGWEPNQRKILPAQIGMYIDADADVQVLTRKRILAEEKLKFLEDVIKHINSRGYLVSTMVNFLKFKMGV